MLKSYFLFFLIVGVVDTLDAVRHPLCKGVNTLVALIQHVKKTYLLYVTATVPLPSGFCFPSQSHVYIEMKITPQRRYVSPCCYWFVTSLSRQNASADHFYTEKSTTCPAAVASVIPRLRFIFHQFHSFIHHTGAVAHKHYYRYYYIEFRPSCCRTRFIAR